MILPKPIADPAPQPTVCKPLTSPDTSPLISNSYSTPVVLPILFLTSNTTLIIAAMTSTSWKFNLSEHPNIRFIFDSFRSSMARTFSPWGRLNLQEVTHFSPKRLSISSTSYIGPCSHPALTSSRVCCHSLSSTSLRPELLTLLSSIAISGAQDLFFCGNRYHQTFCKVMCVWSKACQMKPWNSIN